VNGSSYYVWVRAVNSAGMSGFSDPSSGIPTAGPTPNKPPVPTGLRAIDVARRGMIVAWDALLENVAEYRLFYGVSPGAYTWSTTLASTSYGFTYFRPGMTYYFTVREMNGSAEGDAAAEIQATTLPPLPAGQLDTGFDIGTGVEAGTHEGSVWSLMLQSDGRIVIVGTFTSYDGNGRPGRRQDRRRGVFLRIRRNSHALSR